MVGNENVDSLDGQPTRSLYDCDEQDPSPYFSLVGARGKNGLLAAAVTRVVHELEPRPAASSERPRPARRGPGALIDGRVT